MLLKTNKQILDELYVARDMATRSVDEAEQLERRVIMLELLLERAMQVIGVHARRDWSKEAAKHYMEITGDKKLSKSLAKEAWKREMGCMTKDFSYPIPPDSPSNVVQSDVSYWTD